MSRLILSKILPYAAVLAVLIAFAQPAHAEPDDDAPAMISVVLQSESIELPFSFAGLADGVIHPGVQVGVEWSVWRAAPWQLTAGANAGYYCHADLQHGVYLVPTVAGEVRPLGGWVSRVDLGAGALHTWSAPDAFALQDDGSYEPATDWGRLRFMPQASVGSGWAFDAPERMPLEVFVRYTVFFELPFSSPNDIPAMFHTLTQIGVRFALPSDGGGRP